VVIAHTIEVKLQPPHSSANATEFLWYHPMYLSGAIWNIGPVATTTCSPDSIAEKSEDPKNITIEAIIA
jgi:hypothetical protein